MSYDYLVVGAGLYGSIFAHEANKKGKKCLVIDKRDHIGGNIYTQKIEDINVHKYGAHIFHTSDDEVWEYINRFSEFNNFINSPIAVYKDKLYNLPFNMNTFNQIWGVKTPSEALEQIQKQVLESGIKEPTNLAEKAISLVGKDVYEILIKGYTEKQWGKSAEELPNSIINRIPVRYKYDNNYFNDKYQGIPVNGYTSIIEKMLNGVEVRTNVDFFKNKTEYFNIAKRIVFTGMIDEYYDYCFGELEYRSLKFDTKVLDEKNYQANAVFNYTEFDIPYTRVIEHKHFEFGNQEKTVITHEYPQEWTKGAEAYYPINDENNTLLYNKYLELSEKEDRVHFGGRLGHYKYYDMDKVIKSALEFSKENLI